MADTRTVLLFLCPALSEGGQPPGYVPAIGERPISMDNSDNSQVFCRLAAESLIAARVSHFHFRFEEENTIHEGAWGDQPDEAKTGRFLPSSQAQHFHL